MSFCKPSEIVPKNLMMVIPERYKGMSYVRSNIGDVFEITDITIVSYKAKRNGEYIKRMDGTYVLNQTVYFGFKDGKHYSSLKNDAILGQVAQLTGWYETVEKEDYYPLDKPEKVKIVETTVRMGKGENAKNVPAKAFESIE